MINALRFVERDGKKILQCQLQDYYTMGDGVPVPRASEWQDVPLLPEHEQLTSEDKAA